MILRKNNQKPQITGYTIFNYNKFGETVAILKLYFNWSSLFWNVSILRW